MVDGSRITIRLRLRQGLEFMQAKIGTGLSWLLMLLCAGFITYFFSANTEQIGILARISPTQIALLVALHLGYLMLHGYRYLVTLRQCSGRQISFRPWFRIYVLGRFLNLIVPEMGNLYRGVLVKKSFGISYTSFASGFLAFAWISNLLNLTMALVVILAVAPGLLIAGVPVAWMLSGFLMALAAGPVLIDWGLSATTVRQRHLAWLHAKAAEAVRGAVNTVKDKGHLAWVATLGLAQFLVACLIFYVCFLALGVRVEIGAMVLFYVLLQFSVYVNLTPGNLGIQEVVFGLVGDMTGIGMAEGMLVSVLLRTTGYVAVFAFALPMGGLEVLRQRERYRS